MDQNLNLKLENRLKKIYKDNFKEEYTGNIINLIYKWKQKEWKQKEKISEKNIYLITYGDSIYENGVSTLKTLQEFLDENVKDAITDVHLLPMFDYTSDDGFSVVDYRKINPKLGDWNDIESLSKNYRLMFDFVANHMSKSSSWFQGYLKGEEKYKNYFTAKDEKFDTDKVVRPRTSSIYHEYKTEFGVKTAWTTFSEDQVDLNFQHFPVLEEMTDILIEYSFRGASSIRLDAIGFMWKISGTSCIHLEETHEIIKLWRDILDILSPNTQIITETNVPHLENISYFGNGNDEANQVYQFTLPPLTLFALTTHNSEKLTAWAKTINNITETATFFNFLSSHDGIGLRPVEGILTDEEKELLAQKVLKNGGRINYKKNVDGSESPYELNIVYQDALLNLDEDTDEEIQVKKILASHSILLSFVGVPAIYYHSLLGSRNDYKGLEESGINRRINREKLEISEITRSLKEDSRRNKIFLETKKLIEIRKRNKVFSPYAPQEVLDLGSKVFAIKRTNSEEEVICITNIDSKKLILETSFKGVDLISGKIITKQVELDPYGVVWIKL
ncbi:MAG: sugar phosphorylase [Cetobacterium sp.]